MSSAGAVVERYAQAIFELGLETGELGAISEGLRAVAEVYSNSRDLRVALESPVLDEARRQEILREVAERVGVRGTALNALRVLAQRRRLAILPELARELTRLSDEQQGVLRASVTCAAPLPESYFQSLVQKLEASTRKKVVLERREDPSLIGGVVLRIGDSILDGSIRGRLNQLERRLLAEASAGQA